MKTLRRSLAVAAFATLVPLASAKTLTEKEVDAAATKIDGLVEADLSAAGISPNALVDDGTFLRRAYLGIAGRIPTEEETREFFANESPDKRMELIDMLVASPGFDSHLFNWAGDLLRIQTKQEQFGLGWHVWLRKSLAEDKPWDELVYEMLGSEGHASKNPAVGYYLRDRNMQLDNFSNTMQVFLGRQIGCAQCHDHPFDDWSQYDYYQMAAFGGGFTYDSKEVRNVIQRVSMDIFPIDETAQIGKKGKNGNKGKRNNANNEVRKTLNPVFKDFNKNALFDDPTKSLRLPEDYQYKDAAPKSEVSAETLFGEHIEGISPAERRETFAKWTTSPENPFFTKVIANRMWARVFGHGLQEPIDDWSEDSTPAHPELMAFLEEMMKEADYDLRTFSQILFRTQLFQRECAPEEAQTGTAPLVQGPALRRMTAEQLFDSMLVLTREEIQDAPPDKWEEVWEDYAQNVGEHLNMESKELMALGKAAGEAEKAFEAVKSESRRLQVAISKMDNGKEKEKAMAALRKTREELKEYNQQRYPVGRIEMGGGGKNNKMAIRAADYPAPFNPASLVREFGGSDRSIPSSGDTIPTVPQALALLNDYQTDIVKGKGTPLYNRLSSAKSAEEKLEIVFLRLYSRKPDGEERERYLPLVSDNETFRSLIRAMLTSNRFIFVQ
ncbi:MAG: DUF1549 and DUF1553 domain-containing protein [Akkermansiaceae bacterium]|nr:DUF1549 and DUF1553 domain-containing protein [Akkermansiaceae bacterium]MDP4645692.1 DUF1549 and DUF1553 domain-containing protein [Akkermansiaceae bacterium]MDP4721628.1 DUF1549 and DUF1553 domain-containing protein [Akkermansiaceae bacterium]MDP4778800.1 DUF1549 and DUF1553 domain-containing protein [Akkermansiaceae bacterium]MDP4846998.1 DUF1549 and DUF1553 domain-containing protein [Akkermansiaceae bacterium]